MLGYLTFGDRIESLIIYNLPNNDTVSIFAKAFYILTISGSFVLIIQPIFRVIETSECYHKISDCIQNLSKKLNEILFSENESQPNPEAQISHSQHPAVPALSNFDEQIEE